MEEVPVAKYDNAIVCLWRDKFDNFKKFFDIELCEAGVQQKIDKVCFEDLVTLVFEYASYLHFIDAGSTSQLDILFALAASLSEDPLANSCGEVYKGLSVEKKEKLMKYLKFFLHCVQLTIKNNKK